MSNRCLYNTTFRQFIDTAPKEILGTLHLNYHGDALTTTDDAWIGEITLLQQVLLPWKDEPSQIIFEYDIPRLGKRIDVVLLLRGIIICLEFKVGQSSALQADVEQVMDYALDLKNFHLYSHDRTIVPILVPTNYTPVTTEFRPSVYDDSIYNPLISGADNLQNLISGVLEHAGATTPSANNDNWIISPYTPTPTIIEAARSLYENHSVEDITRHEADKVFTDATTNYILRVLQQSKEQNAKSICFVTGVPGAGKTLVGLDVAIKQTYKDGELDKENGAVYLSGNGPLVAVLTEALARDNLKKCAERGEKKNLSDSRREVGEFIQIIHRYRDNMLAKIKNPVENGLATRVCFAQLPDTSFTEIPVFAPYEDEEKDEIIRWARRLDAEKGTIACPGVGTVIADWLERKRQQAIDADSHAMDILRRRAAVIGFRAGMLCFLLEDHEYTDVVGEFAEWVAEYVFRNQMELWGEQMEQELSGALDAQTERGAAASLLALLPEEFTASDLIKLRARKGQSVKTSAVSMVLNRWRTNHRIVKINETTWRKL